MRTPRSSEFIGPSRREVILLGIGAFAVATAPFLIGRRRHLVRRSVPVMGTIADIGVVHRDQTPPGRSSVRRAPRPGVCASRGRCGNTTAALRRPDYVRLQRVV